MGACIHADWYIDNKISAFDFRLKKNIEYVNAVYNLGEESEWGNCGSGYETRREWTVTLFPKDKYPLRFCQETPIYFDSGESRDKGKWALQNSSNTLYRI
ncbi:hypothetical protein [Capnocytophaga catalasegens]|uniref:Uncharacterized protein n=1 Tax=Capnocytophaga catalasegens TaxID=1004260 RepID=A0AAV5AX61_9FLAO|nr:hypothetical protein [Capnocytophaga catalasegens]GIZ15736.1 hypothetical protein RCZ03_17360 [Capnocytophaga catalasegens]GJM50123.1 hypothetical protein RCZ15_10970 [Capnocytophaga catalasegens]GJM53052.1 hypothetical protein RCZ16_13690 [Capnocytophaga catalasegens]